MSFLFRTCQLGFVLFCTLICFSTFSDENQKRVVTLIPNLAEIFMQLNEGKESSSSAKLVGISEYSDKPIQLKKLLSEKVLTSIGPYFKPNLETVLSLKPDVVIGSKDGTPKSFIEQIESISSRKIEVVLVDAIKLSDIEDSYEKVSQILGSKRKLEFLLKESQKFKEKLKNFAKENVQKKCYPSLIALFYDSSGTSLIAVGRDNYINELLGLAGFTNLIGKEEKFSKSRYPRISKEEFLRDQKGVLIVFGNEKNSDSELNDFTKNIGWKGQTIVLKRSEIQRPTFGVYSEMVEIAREIRIKACGKS